MSLKFTGLNFAKREVPLLTGGVFEFDAVATDDTVFALISTSASKTVSGNPNTGAIRKILSDLYRFEQLPNEEAIRALVFSELTMVEKFKREQSRGRVSENIQIIHAPLPDEIQGLVERARALSRDEQSSRKPGATLDHEVLKKALGADAYERLVMKKGEE